MKALSVRWKITFISGLCLVLTSMLLIGFSVYNAQENQRSIKELSSTSVVQKSQQLLESQAKLNVAKIKQHLEEAFYRGEMLSESALFLQLSAEENFTSSEDLRTSLVQLIKRSVERFPSIHGAYLVFNKDALDSEDANYHDANYVGSNEEGRFATYWQKSSDGSDTVSAVISEPALKAEKNYERFVYPLQSAQPCITTPGFMDGDGKQLVSSISFPLIRDGEAIGFIGIDLVLDFLTDTIQETDTSLFAGKGNVHLLTSSGMLIASDDSQATIGEAFKTHHGNRSVLLEALKSDTIQVNWVDNDQWLVLLAPVQNANQQWNLLLEMPSSSVLEDADYLDQTITQQMDAGVLRELVAGISFVIVGLLVVAFSAFRLVKPIQEVVSRLQDIASGDGDLTQRLEIRSEDEIGQLAQGFNQFLDKLQNIIKQVIETTNKVADTARQAEETAGVTRNSSEAQFREVDLVATASEEMTQTASQVVENADIAVRAATQANESAMSGQKAVEQSSAQMGALVERMNHTVNIVQGLATNNANITDSLTVIEDISEQTNLLALNAAIEAARAGEQGRGFAVVADEVRNLASRTQTSVDEIKKVIEQVKTGTDDVVSAIQEGNTVATSTSQQVDQAVGQLNDVFESIAEISEMNSQIVRAAEEQQSVSGEVNSNVANIRDLSARILEQAESSEKVGREIAELSTTQQALVNQFRV
jgi:methyl-accepting chemotaxis protein